MPAKWEKGTQDEMGDNTFQLRHLLSGEKGMGTQPYKSTGQMSSRNLFHTDFQCQS